MLDTAATSATRALPASDTLSVNVTKAGMTASGFTIVRRVVNETIRTFDSGIAPRFSFFFSDALWSGGRRSAAETRHAPHDISLRSGGRGRPPLHRLAIDAGQGACAAETTISGALRRSKSQVLTWRQACREAEQSTQPPVAASGQRPSRRTAARAQRREPRVPPTRARGFATGTVSAVA